MLLPIFLSIFYLHPELIRCTEQTHLVPELAIRDPFEKPVSPILIQASSFEHLVERSAFFLDRSLLVKEIFEHESDILIITMPSGFGKTMNLGLIRAFFEIQVDDEGVPIEPLNQTTHYRLFKRGEIIHRRKNMQKLKTPLLIATRHANFTDSHLGTRPVVYISFSSPRGDTFGEIIDDLKQRISHVYEEFSHLLGVFRKILNNPESAAEQKAKAERDIEMFKKHAFKRSSLEEMENSLAFLCNALYESYGNEAILLVDDYDAILNHTLFSDKFLSRQDEDMVIEFFKRFVRSSVNDTKAIKKTIFSGSVTLEQGSLMPELNTSTEYTVRENQLSSFYACEDTLVDEIWQQIDVKKFARDMLRAMRAGYRIGPNSSRLYYDPLTWACCSGSCLVPRPHSLFVNKFLNVVSFRNAVFGLISMCSLEANISDVHFSRDDFKVLKTPPANESSLGPFVRSSMKYWYATGLLTLANTSTETRLSLQFPSESVCTIMRQQLMAYYVRKLNIHNEMLSTKFSLIADLFHDFSRSFESTNPKSHTLLYSTDLKSLLSYFYVKLLDPARNPHPDEGTIRDSVDFLTIFFEKFKRMITYGREIAVYTDDYVLMIFESTFDENSAQQAIERAKNGCQSFRKYDNFNMFKFVGINVRPNGTVDILGENKFYRELFERSFEVTQQG